MRHGTTQDHAQGWQSGQMPRSWVTRSFNQWRLTGFVGYAGTKSGTVMHRHMEGWQSG